MTPVQAVCRRTVSACRASLSSAFVFVAFLAATAVRFAFSLERFEGDAVSLATVWAMSVAPILPVLVAFLGMDVWSEERRSRRIDILLSTAVLERDFVWGKTLGVFFETLSGLVLSLVFTLLALALAAPAMLAGVSILSFLPAFFILVLQGFLWTAVTVSASAAFVRPAASLGLALTLTVGLPRAGWFAWLNGAPGGRLPWGEMPLDAHVVDFAAGWISSGTVCAYVLTALFFVFLTVRRVEAFRYPGRTSVRRSLMRFVQRLLAFVLVALAVALAIRLDFTLDVPVRGGSTFAARFQRLLGDSYGSVTVTCFQSRSAASFRTTAQLLRTVKRQADALGGAALTLRFVDPNWDLGAAERLIRQGVPVDSVVFEKGHRLVFQPLAEGCDERLVLAAFQRLLLPPSRRHVYWTTGHGEASFSGYGPWDMSDMAREMVRAGYENAPLDLASGHAPPDDCALLIVAGAKTEFSRVELGLVETYLRAGGRLLVLMGPPGTAGVAALLPTWGINAHLPSWASARTLSGTDVIVSDFADHAVSTALAGERIVLEHPLAFRPSAAVARGADADRLTYAPLASVGSDRVVAAAVERGAEAGNDLTIRPTRIVVVGDATFALNGSLAARANANRTWFLNAVAYLSGTDAEAASAPNAGVLRVRLDRSGRLRLVIGAGVVGPCLVFLLLFLRVLRRRSK